MTTLRTRSSVRSMAVPPTASRTLYQRLFFQRSKDVMDSLNGFDSGIAIHYRQSQFYMKAQARYLKNHLHSRAAERAGRARAAPHIKTYLRVDSTWSHIKWFLLMLGKPVKAGMGN